MIRRNPDGTENPREFFINADLTEADPASLSIGGYYERHPFGQFLTGVRPSPPTTNTTDFLEPRDAAATVMRWTYGCTIVGAQPWFDTSTLERLLRSEGLRAGHHYRLRCVENLTAGKLGREDIGGQKACAEALGLIVNPTTEHTALGDALVAKAIYDAVMTP